MAVVQEFRRGEFAEISVSLLTALLFCALIFQNTGLPTILAYAMTAAVYAAIAAAFVWYTPKSLQFHRRYTLLFFVFAAVVFVRTAIDPALGDTVRLVVLLSFTAVNLFVFPQLCSFRQFCNIGSRISAILVLIGFLPYLGLSLSIGFLDLSLWGSSLYWYPDLQPMMSVFVNPNQLGALTLFATIATIRELRVDRTPMSKLLVTLNFLGLAFSNYRTGWAAFSAASALFFVYALWGRKAVILATIGGFSALLISLLMMFGVIPGPEFFRELSLNGRRALWTGSVDALRDQIFLGHHFTGVTEVVGNPHNSYLRMFVGFGVVGGMAYFVLSVSTALDAARQATTDSGLVLAMLLVSFVIIQVFNQLSFVGISMRSTLIALSMGYLLTSVVYS